MKKVTLEVWAKARYNPPPVARTLQRWARENQLCPPPVKLGRTYYIRPDAQHISEVLAGGDQPTLIEQIGAAR